MDVAVFSDALWSLISKDAQLEVVKAGFTFIEGPVWRKTEADLLFSDIPEDTIYQWSEPDGLQVFRRPSGRSNGLTLDGAAQLIACEHGNRRVSATEPDGDPKAIATHYQGKRLNSPNDVVVAADGTIFFTDPPYGIDESDAKAGNVKELDWNGVYRLEPGCEPVLLVDDFDRPNGLALSPDESRLYVDDTARMHVRAFDVTPDKSLANGRVLAELDPTLGKGVPDGMKIDSQGNLYVTGPAGVWIFTAAGDRVGVLRIPEVCANLAWGDADGQTLYFTATSTLYRVRMTAVGAR